MKIRIRIKSISRRKPILELTEHEVPDGITSGEVLIKSLVRDSVRRYNAREVDAALFQYLSAEEIEDAAKIGKVGFGDRKDERSQDEGDAVKNALTCYEDGFFKLIVNEVDILPKSQLILKENDEITFIRLVLLAGRMW